MFLYNNHFCLTWKSEVISFIQIIKELKENLKVVHYYITEVNVKSYSEYIYQPKKIQSYLNKIIVYDLETHNTDRARPYVFCFYRLSKLAGRYYRELTHDDMEKCKKDAIAFDGDDCVEKALDFCLKLKGDERKYSKNKLLENNLQLQAHNGSGFDTWLVLNNLPCDKRIVIIIKNGKANIELKVLIGYTEKKTKIKFFNIFILDEVWLI